MVEAMVEAIATEIHKWEETVAKGAQRKSTWKS